MVATKTMRLALFVAALACCAMMVQARPADLEGRKGRSLLYTCKDAQALDGQCSSLCDCVTKKGQTVSNCASLCQSCIDATKSCPADNSLPKACADYSGNSAVSACINGSKRRLF